MIPLRDNIPHLHKPKITYALILFNLLVFIWELSFSPEDLQVLTYYLGLVPARFSNPIWADLVGLPNMGLFPFLTNIFLHGGWLHVIANMWMLWIFGVNVEERMGSWRFFLFYLVCGIVASTAYFISDPASPIPMIGASGAIAGVMGSYFRWYPRAKIRTFLPVFIIPLFFNVPAVLFLGFWFAIQILAGTATLVSTDAIGGVAFWAHIGGFLAGFAFCPLFLNKKRMFAQEYAMFREA